MAAPELPRQGDRSVPNAFESADGEPLAFPEPADLPVAALADDHPVPGMAAAAGVDALDVFETRPAVLELDTGEQPLEGTAIGRPADPADVLALDTVRGMHEPIRELAVGGEDHETRGVGIEPSDRDPATLTRRRQALRRRCCVLRILARADLPSGL